MKALITKVYFGTSSKCYNVSQACMHFTDPNGAWLPLE